MGNKLNYVYGGTIINHAAGFDGDDDDTSSITPDLCSSVHLTCVMITTALDSFTILAAETDSVVLSCRADYSIPSVVT